MTHYVIDARTATPHYPGIGRYISSLTRALVGLLAEQERVTVLCAPDHALDLPETAPVEVLEVAASPFSLAQQWEIPRLLRDLEADLYHSAYYLMPYLGRIPTLLTVHDLIPIRRPEHSSSRARLLFRVTLALALWRARQVVVVSQSTREDLFSEFPRLSSEIQVIPEAPDPAFYPRPTHVVEDLRDRYDLPERFVLYLGSNKLHKNLTRLVEAWADVVVEDPDAALVIAGRWLPEHDEPQTRARELGLEAPNLRWLGPVPGDHLPSLYTAATLFVFPSLYEGFGLPPLEAMACGTPVACSNVSSLPEVVGDAAVTFDPTSVDAITEALLKLWTNPSLLMDRWARGIRRAQHFRWEETARQTLNIYRQVAGMGRPDSSNADEG